MCNQRGFLYLKSDRCGPLSSLHQQHSAPALTLSLEFLRKAKLQFTLLDKLQLLCPEAHLSPTSLILASPSDSSFSDLKIFIIGEIKNLHFTVFLKLAVALCVSFSYLSNIRHHKEVFRLPFSISFALIPLLL